MTKSFKLGTPSLEIDIEGKKYQIKLNQKGLLESFEVLATEAYALSESKNTDVQKLYDVCRSFIEAVLGEGSFNVIFEGREVDVDDCLGLIAFISSELLAFKESRMSYYTVNSGVK